MTQYHYIPIEDDQQTSASAQVNLTLLLEESADAGDHREFAALVEAIDWSTRRPDELTTAIDLALSLEMASLAIELAQLGGRLFSNHERIQQAARVLAPPVVRAVRPSRAKKLDASRTWLWEHASEYRGQWVAVRQGELLDAATSLEALMPLIDEDEDTTSTIVTQVL
jgi:hypothetical protein